MKKLFLLFIPLFLLCGCSLTQEWTGFYYPDKNNLGDTSQLVVQAGFKNVENCRDWAEQIMENNPNADYECGLNCEQTEYKTYTCKETIK